MNAEYKNPFWVQTPDQIPAEEATNLFVDIFTEFPQVEAPMHTFVVGPRGSGKSMMFRMMRPDCLMLRRSCNISELPYLGIYVPIKSTRITATENTRLDDHPARYVFNEHLLCLYIAIATFQELGSTKLALDLEGQVKTLCEEFLRLVVKRLVYCGVSEESSSALSSLEYVSLNEAFEALARILDETYWSEADLLLRSIALQPERLGEYTGALLSYHGFLYPILESLTTILLLEKSKPVYLLIDDADNLNRTQTEILNSWIATRSTHGVCLKLSDQMGYKTMLTHGGKRIQSPHDYNHVDVSVLYTTQRDKYLKRINDIIQKRLDRSGINATPHTFFPEDIAQSEKLTEIKEELRKKWHAGDGHGNRDRDDVTRYARPELIRRLGGSSKSRSTYSYAGFEQLAHISSGVIRYFLEPAATMYSKLASTSGKNVSEIPASVQNDVVKEFSDDFLEKDLANMRRDAGARAGDYEKLSNLIEVLGESFAERLVDENATERRVFSIALSDKADDEVQHILDLGTKEGFFYRATLGAKRGSGRVPRYVLSRRLAPRFKLDPTSFAGYMFVTSDSLKKAISNSKHRLREVEPSEQSQLELQLP